MASRILESIIETEVNFKYVWLKLTITEWVLCWIGPRWNMKRCIFSLCGSIRWLGLRVSSHLALLVSTYHYYNTLLLHYYECLATLILGYARKLCTVYPPLPSIPSSSLASLYSVFPVLCDPTFLSVLTRQRNAPWRLGSCTTFSQSSYPPNPFTSLYSHPLFPSVRDKISFLQPLLPLPIPDLPIVFIIHHVSFIKLFTLSKPFFKFLLLYHYLHRKRQPGIILTNLIQTLFKLYFISVSVKKKIPFLLPYLVYRLF